MHALRGSFTLLRPPFLSSPADLRLGAGRGRLAHGALVRRGCSTALTHLAAVRNQLSALFQKRGSVVLEGGSVLHPQSMIEVGWVGHKEGESSERV